MRRKQPLVKDHYYHIYNRGVNRQPIFFVKENWSQFLTLLHQYFTREKVNILAYCLMPNHYHLLVYLKIDSFGNEVMQPFTVAFAKSINNQHNRVGPLFQGPFKNQTVDQENYLLHLTRYIHLNPVTAGIVSRPEDWIYSSYREYIGMRNGSLPMPEFVLELFEEKNDDDHTAPVSNSARSAYAEFVKSELDSRYGLSPSMLID